MGLSSPESTERHCDSSTSSESEEDAKPAAEMKEDMVSLSWIVPNESVLAAVRTSTGQHHQQPPPDYPDMPMWELLPRGALENIGRYIEREHVPPVASTSTPSDVSMQQQLQPPGQAAMLENERQQQQEMLHWHLSRGLLASTNTATVFPDQAHQATLVAGLDSNAIALLQLQQQQHHLRNIFAPTQPDLAAHIVALQAQQLQLEQYHQLQQQQFTPAAVSLLANASQLNRPLILQQGLADLNPQVAALPLLQQTEIQASRAVGPPALQRDPSVASVHSDSVPNNRELASKGPLKRPKRPLTPYNLFFKARREALIAEHRHQQAGSKSDSLDQQKGEHQHDQQQRPRRNSIGFEDLGKIIGREWKEIDPQTLAVYEAAARVDKERYAKELEVYKSQKNAELEAKRAAMEESVSDEVRQRYFSDPRAKRQKKR